MSAPRAFHTVSNPRGSGGRWRRHTQSSRGPQHVLDTEMQSRLGALWRSLRTDDTVRAIVLIGAGEKAFSAGVDRSSMELEALDPFVYEDPGPLVGPKSQGLWKPVVAAVNGMACGGAFYLLGESDVVLAAEHATFFDPHVTYGMVAAFEPLLLLPRMPFGEVVRMALSGTRRLAQRAMTMGFVSEVVHAENLAASAFALARIFASSPPRAVQATLRTVAATRSPPRPGASSR